MAKFQECLGRVCNEGRKITVKWRDICDTDRGALVADNSSSPVQTVSARALGHPVSRLPGRQNSLCESRTARRPTRYIVVVRCSSLRACWSISVEHSARSSQEPQSDSYNFHAPS